MKRSINPSIPLTFATIIWGVNITVMKVGLQSMAPLPYNTSRLIVAAALGWVLVFALKAYKRVAREDWKTIILVSVLGFAVPQVGITLGVNLTTAGNASLIMSLIPVSVLALNLILGRERLNKWITAGIILSFVGVILVILGTGKGIQISRTDLMGILILFGSQICCAYFTIFSKPLVEKYSPYQVIAYTLTISSLVFMLIASGSLVHLSWSQLPFSAWLSISYSGILALATGNFIWVWAVREIGSSRTAVFNNLTPVFAIITGIIFLHESLHIIQFMGAAFILAGLIITQKGQMKGLANSGLQD